MEKDKSRQYKPSTIRRLDTLSGNECAAPSCTKKLIAEDEHSIISKICHIEAASKEGPRYNSKSNDDYRRSFENLILLCDEHHIIIDNKENESLYSVSLLKEWKIEHEAKILRLISQSNVLSKNPTALSIVINFLGKNILNEDFIDEPKNAPDTSVKINYNNVIRYKPIIEEYAVYQGKLNKIYEEIEKQGSTKKGLILQNIKTLYLREKGRYSTLNEIQSNADEIIKKVEDEIWNKIESSKETINELPNDVLELSILIVLVDAFMRCKILEEPIANDN